MAILYEILIPEKEVEQANTETKGRQNLTFLLFWGRDNVGSPIACI